MTTVASPNAYKESAVLSAPPELLVVMLYDGARRFLFQAGAAIYRAISTKPGIHSSRWIGRFSAVTRTRLQLDL